MVRLKNLSRGSSFKGILLDADASCIDAKLHGHPCVVPRYVGGSGWRETNFGEAASFVWNASDRLGRSYNPIRYAGTFLSLRVPSSFDRILESTCRAGAIS